MAWEQSQHTITAEAGQDLSAKQYYFVTIAADGQCDPTGDGADADGVLQNDPAAAGRAATICIEGITRVVAGAATTKGGLVASDSSGRAVDPVTNDYVLGKFLEAAATAGDIVSILLRRRSSKAP